MTKKDFFRNIVNGQIKHDLANMLNVEAKNNLGGLNFPLVNTVINYMLFFGTLIEGKDNRKHVDPIKIYINLCMSEHEKYLNAQILWDLVRNGASHDYFSRISISKESNNTKVAYVDNTGKIVINSYSLTREFINSIKIFEKKLQCEKLVSRLEQVKKDLERKEDSDNFKAYKNSLLNTQNHLLYPPQSGASLTIR